MSKETEGTAKRGASNTWIDRQFHLAEHGTTVRTEILAGITTFVTMAYVLGTVPNIMANAGLDRGVMLTSMILLIIVTTVAMALVTNRPFALAPGLGSVAIVSGMIANSGISPEITAGVIFWSGVIALEGKNNLAFGDLSSPSVLLALIGFLLILITKQMRVPGYMIFSILITTLVGIPMGLTRMPEAFFMAPSSPFGQFMKIDFLGALQFAYLPFLIAMFVPDFFSTFGTALGVGAKAGFLDEDGNLPGIDKVFKVDAVATALGSLFCMPCMTTYLESSSGVEAGGKTGLTPISTSVCFAFTLLLTPFALMIPSAATAPALIIIGVGMLSSMRNINYDDFTESFPAFICVAFTIFANNIANGICVALPVYVVLKLASGKIKEMPKIMYVLLGVCVLYFYSIIK